jgi:hypothetical protein
MLLNYISIPVFLISLAIGLFFIYVLGPEEKKVFLYPNPQNIMDTIYKDKADQCFKYSSNEVTCPKDTSLIQEVPMQD